MSVGHHMPRVHLPCVHVAAPGGEVWQGREAVGNRGGKGGKKDGEERGRELGDMLREEEEGEHQRGFHSLHVSTHSSCVYLFYAFEEINWRRES